MSKPVAYISVVDWDKLMNYARCAVDNFKSEIGGMAEVVFDDDNDVRITRPVILKQVVDSGSCELDKTALAQYYARVAKKNGTTDFLWWHSHADMGAFWSQTDKTSILENKGNSDHTWSLVLNVRGEHILQLDVFKIAGIDLHKEVVFNLEVMRKSYSKGLDKEVKAQCTKEVHTAYSKPYAGFGYNGVVHRGRQLSLNAKKPELPAPIPDVTASTVNVANSGGYGAYAKAYDMVEDALGDYLSKVNDFETLVKRVKEANFVEDCFDVPTNEHAVPEFAYQLERFVY
jgi:hypothetical protein